MNFPNCWEGGRNIVATPLISAVTMNIAHIHFLLSHISLHEYCQSIFRTELGCMLTLIFVLRYFVPLPMHPLRFLRPLCSEDQKGLWRRSSEASSWCTLFRWWCSSMHPESQRRHMWGRLIRRTGRFRTRERLSGELVRASYWESSEIPETQSYSARLIKSREQKMKRSSSKDEGTWKHLSSGMLTKIGKSWHVHEFQSACNGDCIESALCSSLVYALHVFQ